MTTSQLQNTLLGITLIYGILATVPLGLSQLIMSVIGANNIILKHHLKKIAGDKVNELLELPQIKSLRPIRFKNFFSFLTGSLEAKAVEKIPVPILVDAFFEVMNLSSESNNNQKTLKKNINNMPQSEGKLVFLEWYKKDIRTIKELRSKASFYFAGILYQAEESTRANYRSFVITLSVMIVLLLRVDSIQLGEYFTKIDNINTITTLKIEASLNQEGDIDTNTLIKEYKEPFDGLFFGEFNLPSKKASWKEWASFLSLKAIGLLISILAVSTTTAFSFDFLNKPSAIDLSSN